MYDPGPDLPLSGIPGGTNVLLVGPALTDKRRLVWSLLDHGCRDGEAAVGVSTRERADRLQDRWPSLGRALADGRAGLVDAVSQQQGSVSADRDQVEYVGSPGNMTDIGIRTGGFFRSFAEAGARARVGLVSVSTLLMYADRRRVYRFLHVFTGKVSSHDWVGLYVMETSDQDAVDTFTPLFDALVQTREGEDGGPELRTRGDVEGPRSWTAF